MSRRANHIVLTTIQPPAVLAGIRENLQAHGHLASTAVWVIGDRKTPPAAAEWCCWQAALGLDCRYMDIDAQDAWGRAHCPALYARLPYDNESRRNIGYLLALADGCERLISMDDDNFPGGDDLVGGHQRVGESLTVGTLHEPGGFHNICEHLEIFPHRPIYPRGYPFKRRNDKNCSTRRAAPGGARIGVNAGLWLREPDIDATSWLNGRVDALSYRGPDCAVLAQDTWSPINTQNTCVTRELIAAFLCVPMGFELPAGRIERYGDIWAGYFLQAVIGGTEHHVSFGSPVVEHRRNPHDYLCDLRHEFWGILLTDWLVEQLRERFAPSAGPIPQRVRELGDFLRQISRDQLPASYPAQVRDFLLETAATVELWAGACEVIDHEQSNQQKCDDFGGWQHHAAA